MCRDTRERHALQPIPEPPFPHLRHGCGLRRRLESRRLLCDPRRPAHRPAVPAGRARRQRLCASLAGSTDDANAHGAHGARGVNAQCEYVLTGPGSGTGVCRFSDGANYQMHFGG